MRRELAREKTERDILKKRLATLRLTPSEASFYRAPSYDLANPNHVPCSRCLDKRLL